MAPAQTRSRCLLGHLRAIVSPPEHVGIHWEGHFEGPVLFHHHSQFERTGRKAIRWSNWQRHALYSGLLLKRYPHG